MIRYLVRRLAEAIVTLFGVAVLVFIVMRVLPGDEVTARLGIESGALTDAQRDSLERYYGLDQPLFRQFFSWLGSVLTGNFGDLGDEWPAGPQADRRGAAGDDRAGHPGHDVRRPRRRRDRRVRRVAGQPLR